MPAAAVIPAPIAYIKVVAVKKLVVEFLQSATRCTFGCFRACFCILVAPFLIECCRRVFTLRKLECFKQAFALNTAAWNNKIGL